MSRIAYVNGRYVPLRQATVSIEDRGYQFADGVYEVVTVHRGNLVDEIGHLERLERSLSELRMGAPMPRDALRLVMRQVVQRNRVRTGIIYLQVTRGTAARNHAFPTADLRPNLVMTARSVPEKKIAANSAGVKVITLPDNRWGRCDIKTVGLLPNCLAKQAAVEAGAYEALLIDVDDNVTEGSSTNAWIVDQDGNLVTRKSGPDILNGITRLAVMALAGRKGMRIIERSFSRTEVTTAREVFITSSSSFVTPVVKVDETVIGNGVPGLIATELRQIYTAYMTERDANAAAGALT